MSITSLLNQTITLTSQGQRDKFGKVTFATGTSYPARFERNHKLIFTKQNEAINIDGTVFLNPNVTVAVGDRLVYDSVTYQVMQVNEPVGATGAVHHIEVLVQEFSI